MHTLANTCLLYTSAGGATVRLQISKNDEALWGPQECMGEERDGYEINLEGVAVEAGDVIRFEVSGPGGFITDGLSWAPTIAYVSAKAVSYTHLDVYKRQVRHRVLQFFQACGIYRYKMCLYGNKERINTGRFFLTRHVGKETEY